MFSFPLPFVINSFNESVQSQCLKEFIFKLISFPYTITDRQRNEERKSISDDPPKLDKEKDKKRKPVASTSRVSNFKEKSKNVLTKQFVFVYNMLNFN